MNKDTLQTIARFFLKGAVFLLAAHGVQHAKDLDTPVMETVVEEVLAALVGAASLWWSKRHQEAIARTGDTETFKKADASPLAPKP